MSVETSYADRLSAALIEQNSDLRGLVESVIVGEVASAINAAVADCLGDYEKMATAVRAAIPNVERGPFMHRVNNERVLLRSKITAELMWQISEQAS